MLFTFLKLFCGVFGIILLLTFDIQPIERFSKDKDSKQTQKFLKT